jgi:F-type H+-transporting ATPase subunit g
MSSASSAARAATPESILSNIRNVDRKQLVSISVVFAEVLGFFTVGTMIGRMKVVGYHGEVHHEH